MNLSNELKIGILVIGVLIGLAYITWQAGEFDFTPEGYELKAHFKSIDGVDLNSPVTLNGFEVGRVTDIKIVYGEEANVELTLWVDVNAKVYEDATVLVKNMGFMGEKYIGITAGDARKRQLKPGEIVQGTEPGSFEKLLSDGQEIAKNIKEISVNINERLKVNSENIDSIMADMRTSMSNIASITDNVKERLDVNKLLIDDTVGNLNVSSKNLAEMSADLKDNPWKLLYKPKPGDLKRGDK